MGTAETCFAGMLNLCAFAHDTDKETQISKYHALVVEQTATMLQTISDSLPRFQIYEKLHQDPIVQVALLNVFTDIVNFSLQVSRYFEGSALGRLGRLVATSMRDDLDEIIGCLKIHAKIVDSTAVAAEHVKAAAFRSQMEARDREDLKVTFENWLNPPNIREVHNAQTRKKLHGSCEWIWTHPTFLQWDNPSATSASDRFLYLFGTHGCGKSILASSIVEKLKNQDRLVLFFSFSGTDASRQTLDSMARALLWQLSREITLKETTAKQCFEIMRTLLSQKHPLTSELWDAYSRIAALNNEPIIWIIDGIDECAESIQLLSAQLRDVLASHQATRALLLGRPHLVSEFNSMGTTIEITPSMTKADIEAFIEEAVTDSEVLNQPELREHVVILLQDRADGMFLWVKLMVDDLQKSSSKFELMERLQNMPHGLQDAYRLLFTRLIGRLDTFERRLARCIFSLTIVARRPLKLEELQYAQALNIR
jgi:hypothetical protein